MTSKPAWKGSRVREPVEGFDLAAGEADQGVAVAEGVVHEGERMVPRANVLSQSDILARSTAIGFRSIP